MLIKKNHTYNTNLTLLLDHKHIYIKERKQEWENKRRNLPSLLYIISLIFVRYLGEDNSQQNYKYHQIELDMKNWKMFDLKKHSDIHVMCLLGRLKYSELERLIESHKNKTQPP